MILLIVCTCSMLFVAVYVPPRFTISPNTFTLDFANASQYPMYWNLKDMKCKNKINIVD